MTFSYFNCTWIYLLRIIISNNHNEYIFTSICVYILKPTAVSSNWEKKPQLRQGWQQSFSVQATTWNTLLQHTSGWQHGHTCLHLSDHCCPSYLRLPAQSAMCLSVCESHSRLWISTHPGLVLRNMMVACALSNFIFLIFTGLAVVSRLLYILDKLSITKLHP